MTFSNLGEISEKLSCSLVNLIGQQEKTKSKALLMWESDNPEKLDAYVCLCKQMNDDNG